MSHSFAEGVIVRPPVYRSIAACMLFGAVSACAVAPASMPKSDQALRDTANLIQEVKAFGQTRGLEPTGALSRTTEEQPALSMLWLWLQRDGTLALRGPIDIRLAIGFSNTTGPIPLEQVYRVDGYSVYYRQGNEFEKPM